MTPHEELFAIANRLKSESASPKLAAAGEALNALETTAREAARAFSGSWLGYHSHVYYAALKPPPPGAHFSQEWGLMDVNFTSLGSRGDWEEYDPEELQSCLRARAGNTDLGDIRDAAADAESAFSDATAEIQSILLIENAGGSDTFLAQLMKDLRAVRVLTTADIVDRWSPKGQVMTRDATALGQGRQTPPIC